VALDAASIERCRAGDEAAWKELFDAHFDFVRGTARRLGTPEPELDDVCQEAFLVVFQRAQDFTHGRFTTWLYRIVANVVSYRHRRRRFRRALLRLLGRELTGEASAGRPDAEMQRREEARMVGSILERMSPKKREVLALYELEGLDGNEIAERVGCPPETVRTRLHHARKEFQRLARNTGLVKETNR
jgi:RNA polymerase sigma-70 factor (ECF subfamily)